MYLKKIRLVCFRNYLDQIMELNENANLFLGNNGQGKTNILEAIYICSVGKSHRLAKDTEMVFFGKQGYFIEIDLIKNKRSYRIEYGFDHKKGKRIKAGGIQLKKIAELLGKLAVVMFCPDDLSLVKESPAYRRRFLDILICQLHASYLYDLQQYYKVLEQRNNLLKQINVKSNLSDTLDIWDEKLIEIGTRIIIKRIEFSKEIMKETKKIHNKLTTEKEDLIVDYKNACIFKYCSDDYKDIKESFNKNLKKNRELDIKRGFTSIGPHRDDLKLSINGLDVSKYGSQGQQRTVVLSLKLAELEILKKEIGDTPILLLDDVFSELDEIRRKILWDYIKDIQVLITRTDDNEENIKNNKLKVFYIQNGKVIRK